MVVHDIIPNEETPIGIYKYIDNFSQKLLELEIVKMEIKLRMTDYGLSTIKRTFVATDAGGMLCDR